MKKIILIFVKVYHKICHFIHYRYEYIYYHFFYSTAKLNMDFSPKRYLIVGGSDLDSIARAYHELFLDKMEDKIAQADLICEHIFDLLGSGLKKLSPQGEGYQPIDWHSDFKSGYKWNPGTFYRDIRYGNVEGVDVKMPWELSRFQHLNTLGQAYLLTAENILMSS